MGLPIATSTWWPLSVTLDLLNCILLGVQYIHIKQQGQQEIANVLVKWQFLSIKLTNNIKQSRDLDVALTCRSILTSKNDSELRDVSHNHVKQSQLVSIDYSMTTPDVALSFKRFFKKKKKLSVGYIIENLQAYIIKSPFLLISFWKS